VAHEPHPTALARTPVYRQVADHLRKAIQAGHFATGEELPAERELAEQYGVSRTTVREALRALQALGLIDTDRPAPFRAVVTAAPEPVTGVFGTLLRAGEVSPFDLIQFRGMLEVEALDRAVVDPDAGRWREGRALLAEVKGAIGSPTAFATAYAELHLAIGRWSGNAALHRTLQAMLTLLREHLVLAFERLGDEGSLEAIVAEQVALLDALEAGDAAGARAVLLDHINALYDRLFASSHDD
jgi:GntR family transcriptional repressor for pyruvate dehydrogenase complex